MGGKDVLPGREELAASNIPWFNVPEKAVEAMKAMVDYAAWKRQPPRVVTRFPVHRRRVERVISRHLKRGHREISEVQAKEILRAYDFNVPEGFITGNPEEAVEVAEKIGYPVAMKIASYDIIHKSQVGGVKLNIATAEGVRDTFELMISRVNRRAANARVEGVYVEQMCPPGLGVIIGMRTDPEFGPMLMFGLGGIFVEVLEDITFHLAPITEDEAIQMLLGSRSYSMLIERRGQGSIDLHAVANGLQHISQLVTDFPQIAELDINPFLVGEVGSMPIVVDARIILSGADKKNE
jgi:acetyltransferase